MSNIEQILPKAEPFKKQYLDFLGSPEFLTTIQNYELAPELFNELFSAHILTIGAQSTGIREGGVHLEYVTSSADNFQPDIPGPRLTYHFYTTQNGIIQTGQGCTNSYLSIKPAHSYPFRRPRELRNFLDKYWNNMPHMPHNTLDDFKSYEFHLKFEKTKDKFLKNDHLYDCIIEPQPSVKSFLQWHFLQKNLKFNSVKKMKNKI